MDSIIDNRAKYIRNLLIDSGLEPYGFEYEDILEIIKLPPYQIIKLIIKLKELADNRNLSKAIYESDAEAMELMNRQLEHSTARSHARMQGIGDTT